MTFEVTGKAAHSGGNFEKGISAIGELAHKIVAIHALTDLKRGVTLNVGLVKGGQSVNTTAPSRRRRRSTCATSSRRTAPTTLAAIQAHHRHERPCPAPRRGSTSAASSCR